MNLFKLVPSTDRLLKAVEDEFSFLPKGILKDGVVAFLDSLRQKIKNKEILSEEELSFERLLEEAKDFIYNKTRPKFRPVINATGVVIHTNLGRSVLAKSAIEAVVSACSNYSNLEFSLETGKRGSRYSLVEDLLCELTGAESGLVVNNNAGAVFITLNTLAKDREVIISRGELIEIGGSFRIPDVIRASGAKLKEVGTTNRTHLYDYENAIGENTAVLLKAHTSNYRIIGFHKEVSVKELVKLGEKYNIPVVEDLGSGNFIEFPPYANIKEPTVQKTIAEGVSVVSFSGDKMLGGPQAGIIVGKKEYIEKIKKNPINRALRIDKMTLAALEATLRLYKDPERAIKEIPTLNLITTSLNTLRQRATFLAKAIKEKFNKYFEVKTKKDSSRVGGGASPEIDVPTYVVKLIPKNRLNLEDFRLALLKTKIPVVIRIEEDSIILDTRTILKGQIPHLIESLEEAIGMIYE